MGVLEEFEPGFGIIPELVYWQYCPICLDKIRELIVQQVRSGTLTGKYRLVQTIFIKFPQNSHSWSIKLGKGHSENVDYWA
jgi:hypothetical protein